MRVTQIRWEKSAAPLTLPRRWWYYRATHAYRSVLHLITPAGHVSDANVPDCFLWSMLKPSLSNGVMFQHIFLIHIPHVMGLLFEFSNYVWGARYAGGMSCMRDMANQ